MKDDWALKYRPNTLSEVVGQDINIEILQDRLSRPYSAMIFYGSSGCGKTTSARALANDLKAEVIELDAAANNSVDDTRELLEYVVRKSLSGGYKLFIIDEAHMLSKAAWNSLLKAIEEPPKGVIFIFCTTEYRALPQTILGRSQLFKFYPLADSDLEKLGKFVLSKEGKEVSDTILQRVIRQSKNQARDFLKLLQKVVDAGVETEQEFEKLLSIPPIAMAGAYLTGVLKGDSKLAVSALKKIKTPLLEWKERLISLIYEMMEDSFGISELRYPLAQSVKLRDLASNYKPKVFGAVLSRLVAIKREEDAYSLLFTLALQGVSD